MSIRPTALDPLSRRLHRSHGEAFTLSVPRHHYQPIARIAQSSTTGLARVSQLPLFVFLRRGFLWTEQYPQVCCHLEQFRFEADNPDAPHTDVRLSTRQLIRRLTRSLESVFLFTVPG